MIEYRDSDHSYWKDGSQVPSVTQILGALNIIDTTWYKPEDAQRGKDIHKVIELYEKGTIDWSTVHEDYLGYLEAYQEWRSLANLTLTSLECPEYHKIYNYAGTPDATFISNTAEGLGYIVDFKTGQPAKWHELQLTAYKMAMIILREPINLWGVYLSKDGSYKQIEYNYVPKDWEAVLRAYKWAK